MKKRSDTEAIGVFRENLQNLLLAPPAGPISVLGIDPGIRTGCKIAVVDETGKFLAHDVIYLQGKTDTAGAASKLKTLLLKHNVRAIAIGNGTASRETDAFVREFLRSEGLSGIFSVTVSESGASVYSASDVARQEFPDLDLTVRGAISIARRLQDPLSELVKVDPKSIGVGQYQHDVDQKNLQQGLETVIESCVNRVGVDLNTASWTLMRYVAGINERTAINIVKFRNENGRFRSRVQLKAVPGIGPKTFEQAAGFLRIRGGENPLDMTAVHPESYPVVEQMAQSLNVTVEEIIKDPKLVEKVDRTKLQAGTFTLNDILEELRKPGRDPRDKFVAPSFNEAVKEICGRPARHGAGRRGDQRDQVRRVRGCRRSSGWPGAHQRAFGPLHQGCFRSGEGRPDRQGEGAERRPEDQTHRAVDESAARAARANAAPAAEAASAAESRRQDRIAVFQVEGTLSGGAGFSPRGMNSAPHARLLIREN